ncbi:MAG: MATE family efflux transporter [Clostridia bacterium]|nr:MATE family efflux transporter [Clostridia bacterium]MBQ6829801.1 MATE family efflux transporter [Clostridia bacterium]
MCNGRILPSLIQYAVPLMLSNLLQLLYNAADVIVVARWAGGTALAAVGSTTSLINLITNLFIGLSIGASVVVAQYYGAGDRQNVSKAVHTAMSISLIGGVFITVFGILIARPALVLMQSPPEVIDQSVLYLTIYFAGAPASMICNFGAAVLRAIGDTKRPLLILGISGIINVVLNLILVIVFHMGVAGVAIATVVSVVFTAVMITLCLVKTHDMYRLEIKKLRIYKDKLWMILKNGIPAAIQSSIFSLSNILIQSSVNSFGAAVVAGNAAAANLEGFIYTAMNAMQHTCLAFTAQNIGAKNSKRLVPIFWHSMFLVTLIGIVLSSLVLCFREPLLSLYTNTSDPSGAVSPQEIITHGITRLWFIAGPYFICGLMDTAVGALRGLGMSVAPMCVSIGGVCGIRILWVLAVFPLFHTMESLFISYALSWIFTTIVHVVCYFVLVKKIIRKIEESKQLEVLPQTE